MKKKEDRRKGDRRSSKIKVDLNKRKKQRRWQGDRRQSPRFETEVWLGTPDGDYFENPKKATISLEGCDFFDTIQYKMGDTILIKFHAPQLKRWFEIEGRIKESLKLETGYLTRIKFTDLSLKDELGLARLFDTLL